MAIPLLIPIAAGVVALVSAITVSAAMQRAHKPLKDKSVAILGRTEVGKSTLLHYLTEDKLPERRKATPDPEPGGQFTLQLPGKGETRFSVPEDLPGHTVPAYKDWHKAFESADFVWYLFRCDLIVNGEESEIALVEEHLAHLGDWYDKLWNQKVAPKVILVGVFADQDPTYNDGRGVFEDRVRNAEIIRQGSLKLGKADIVIGSQASAKGAARLMKRITGYLK